MSHTSPFIGDALKAIDKVKKDIEAEAKVNKEDKENKDPIILAVNTIQDGLERGVSKGIYNMLETVKLYHALMIILDKVKK